MPQLEAVYSLETFKNEWTASYELSPQSEDIILQDLLSRHSDDFEWSKFWSSFGSGELKEPRSPVAQEVFLGRQIPKCNPEVINDFFDYISNTNLSSSLSTKAFCFALTDVCRDKTPSSEALARLSNLITSEKVSDLNCGTSDQHVFVNELLLRVSRHSERGDLFDRVNWQEYFERLLADSHLSSLQKENLNLYAALEQIETLGTEDLIYSILIESSDFGINRLTYLRDHFGLELLHRLLTKNENLRKFQSLDSQDRMAVLELLANTEIENLENSSIALLLKLLSLYSVELSRLELITSSGLELIDGFNRRLIEFIRGLTPHRQTELMLRIEATQLESILWKSWIFSFFSSPSETLTSLDLLDLALIDQFFFHRLRVRQSLLDPYQFRQTIREACRFYESVGMPAQSILLKTPDELVRLNGCIEVQNSESSIELSGDSNIELRPDLILRTMGRSITWKSSGEIRGGFFDLSLDTSRDLPRAPAPIEPNEDENAIAFNLILGIKKEDSYLFFPFHFVAQEPVYKNQPDPNFEIPYREDSGYFRLASLKKVYDLSVVSHGADGLPGATPRRGGRGDRSESIQNYRQFVRTQMEPLYSSLGYRFEYRNEFSKKEWRDLISYLRPNLQEQISNVVFIDEDFNLLTSDHDRRKREEVLRSIELPLGDEMDRYCLSLNSDQNFMRDRFGEDLTRATCERAYRLETLAVKVIDQILALAKEEAFGPQFSQNTDFVIPDMGMSFPGKAIPSGSGGVIEIHSNSQSNLRLGSKPGIAFQWPASWNARPYDGETGAESEVILSPLESPADFEQLFIQEKP